MSFILDALRKSDARRQQTGAPGLNSPEPPRRPRRRRRLLPALLAAAVVVTVAAGGVYVLRPDWLPGPLGDGETPGTADHEPAAGAGAVADRSGEERPDEAPARPRMDEAGQRELAARPSDPASAVGREAGTAPEAEVRDRRRPMPASPERTIRREMPERESKPIPADQATEELRRRMAEEARARREPPQPPAHSATGRSADTGSDAVAETKSAADRSDRREARQLPEDGGPEPASLNEGVAEYVRAWELPLSVRRNLPDLDLSIHVFSPVESERFVLINGERYGPGDAIGEVEIVDISRDGAIVDFRSHRFLLEPR